MSALGLTGKQLMPAGAWHENQAGPGQQHVLAIGAQQRDAARLQQMNITTPLRTIVGREAA
ncbi:hypothetical protein D3C80_2166560 [compost metagenome]